MRFENKSKPQLLQKYGYAAEAHSVVTEDGYILELHRITGRPQKKQKEREKPVLIMHGLEGSSADFVLMGPKQGFGYYLSDHGYDVWLGNARGNRYSRKHVYLSPARQEFWRFSWHSMGLYDLPALIDYILKITVNSQLSYFGFSQGSTSFFVMASERPKYLHKLTHMQALSPVAFLKNTRSPLFRLSTVTAAFLDSSKVINGPFEFLQNSPVTHFAAKIFCNKRGVNQLLCRNLYFMIGGFETKQINTTMLPILFSHAPAGSSSMQFSHYGQCVNSGKFRQYDYGKNKNLIRYGNIQPPDYNLTKVSIPIALHYSDNDDISRPIDVKMLPPLLPNLIGVYRVPYTDFNHLDFLFGMDARTLVYDKVIDILHKYS